MLGCPKATPAGAAMYFPPHLLTNPSIGRGAADFIPDPKNTSRPSTDHTASEIAAMNMRPCPTRDPPPTHRHPEIWSLDRGDKKVVIWHREQVRKLDCLTIFRRGAGARLVRLLPYDFYTRLLRVFDINIDFHHRYLPPFVRIPVQGCIWLYISAIMTTFSKTLKGALVVRVADNDSRG